MSRIAIETMIERWMSDPLFREEMRADPEATIKRHRYDLTEEELVALRSLDLNLTDEELAQRVNFGG